jgi:hypothetical protein
MSSVMVSAEEAVQTKALHMNFHSYGSAAVFTFAFYNSQSMNCGNHKEITFPSTIKTIEDGV